jgi:peptide/nickel transport system substrate-binding protein
VTATTVPAYAGPYTENVPNFYSDDAATTPVANDTAAYDSAVVCDGNTITFNLKQTVADFNYTTTLGFGAVPNPVDHPGVDTAEAYVGDAVWSDGPYKISEYTPGEGGALVLSRNENWKRDSDDYRGAYPDEWNIDFGLDLKLIDQRLIQSTGNDAFAIDYSATRSSRTLVRTTHRPTSGTADLVSRFRTPATRNMRRP